jgi:type IV pilus assembly protein PilQ
MSSRGLAIALLALATTAPALGARADDEQPLQIHIEARIVEADADFARDLGVRFGFDAGDVSGSAAPGAPFSPDAPLFDPGADLAGPWIGGLRTPGAGLDGLLSALERDGRGEVLSAPKLSTADGETAEIEVGPTSPTRGAEPDAASGDAGLSFRLRPVVTEDGSVVLRIELVEAAPTSPPSEPRTLDTTVDVPDRGTLVIGGLRREPQRETGSQVPLLGEVPWVGQLFRDASPSASQRNLLIFVTPRILGATGGSRGGRRATRTGGPQGTRQQQTVRPRPDPHVNRPNVPQGGPQPSVRPGAPRY